MKNFTFFLVLYFSVLPRVEASDRPLIPCSSEQLDILNQSLSKAKNIADHLVDKLKSPDFETSKRLIEWFNPPNIDFSEEAIKVFESVSVWADNVSFLCIISSQSDDSGPIYAYVYPDDYFVIQVGSEFFKAEDEGFNSKAGTLLHELTHFILVGGTNGGVFLSEIYGVEGAFKLAKDDPEHAQKNAENYEYFAESLFWSLDAKF